MGIKIRKKKLASGRQSVYLDIHHQGSRDYEFLGIYLTGDNVRDKEKMRKAEIIRARYLEKIQNNTYGLTTKATDGASFYDYFQEIVDKNMEKGIRNHEAVLIHIKKFHGNSTLRFKDITKRWVWGFRDYLIEETKKQNTAHNYYTIFKAAINRAVKREIIHRNPANGVDNIGPESTVRNYLTVEELKKLSETDVEPARIKDAFFFACYTGLRISDVKRIQWKEVKDDKIFFKQKKTTKVNTVPLNENAKKYMGDRAAPADIVFDIPSQSNIWFKLRDWGKDAELNKNISFHVSRHTFATLLLNNGADIYTVAELLGVDLKTAEVYAKIISRTKEDAVNKLPDIENISA